MADFVAIFNASFERVSESRLEGTFFRQFYAFFIGSSEKIAEKFKNTDLERQRGMLRISLIEMLAFSTSHRSTPYMDMLAAIHSKTDKDITPGMYDAWLDAILKTVKQVDPEYSDDVALSWKIILSPGIEFMKHHYE